MAQNETIIQVPAELNEPIQVRKFLLKLVEKLDIVLGFRGQDPYVTATDLKASAEILANLPSIVKSITTDINEAQKDITTLQSEQENLSDSFENEQNLSFTTTPLGVAYNDFNYTGYATLKGYSQFTALGSAITNPPAGASLVGATSYTVLIHSYINSGGGATTEVYITSATTKTFHKRAGPTSALYFSLGWF